MPTTPTPVVEPFYETTTGTLTYLVHDPATWRAAVIDPLLTARADFPGGGVTNSGKPTRRAGV